MKHKANQKVVYNNSSCVYTLYCCDWHGVACLVPEIAKRKIIKQTNKTDQLGICTVLSISDF